jgi:hypothetical protein
MGQSSVIILFILDADLFENLRLLCYELFFFLFYNFYLFIYLLFFAIAVKFLQIALKLFFRSLQ